MTVYSADHGDDMDVGFTTVPRVGDAVVLPSNDANRIYNVEIVRWLLDEDGKRTGLETRMLAGFGANHSGQDDITTRSGKISLAFGS